VRAALVAAEYVELQEACRKTDYVEFAQGTGLVVQQEKLQFGTFFGFCVPELKQTPVRQVPAGRAS
jgi:hypothetical protein